MSDNKNGKSDANSGQSPFEVPEDKDPYDLNNISVLIVEDSVYLQNLIVSMLKAFGVGDIMSCRGGEEAKDLLTISLAKSKSRHITDVDIVLTDWLMTEGSGEELVKWICNHEKDEIRFLPIVVVSAYTTEYVTVRTRELGVNETLTKPVSGKALAQRICSIIDNPRSFINSDDYFGPDRRRQNMPFRGEERRVMEAEIVEVTPK